MTIALSAAPGIWTPLLGLLRWLTPGSSAPAVPGKSLPAGPFHANPVKSTVACARPIPTSTARPPRLTRHRPLRIVRILETDQAPSQVGRMVISGRMADVCAELDRLAACEAPGT